MVDSWRFLFLGGCVFFSVGGVVAVVGADGR